MQILMANVTLDILGPVFSLSIKFGASMFTNGRFMAKNVIFNMAAAAITSLM